MLDPKGNESLPASVYFSDRNYYPDAVPLHKLPLNRVPFVPNNESLLGILDRFQEGCSHMAIVSRFSVEKATSVKKVAKRTLTQRLRHSVGISDSSDSSDSNDEEGDSSPRRKSSSGDSGNFPKVSRALKRLKRSCQSTVSIPLSVWRKYGGEESDLRGGVSVGSWTLKRGWRKKRKQVAATRISRN